MTISVRQNVVQLLEADHLEIEDLLDRFEETPPEHRTGYFCHLAACLIHHEVAEELVVFPALARSNVPGGLVSANSRMAEQADLEALLEETAAVDLSVPGYETSFARLRSAVNRHRDLEEWGAFSMLFAAIGSQALVDLGSRYTRAKSAFGRRSHPRTLRPISEKPVNGPIHDYADQLRAEVRRAA